MMAIFDKWVQDQVIKLPKITKQPTAEEQKNPKYCCYQRYVHHPTVDCWTLKWEVNRKIQDGTLQLSEEQQKVHKTPFPNYKKDKNKAVVSVVTHGNVSDMEVEESAVASSSLVPVAVRTLQKSPKFKSLFNQLGFGPEARNASTEALITIVAESGAICFTAEAHASHAFLETTNAITFTDEDMEVQYPDHRRPLYLSVVVKDVQVRRALVDTGSCLNLIPLSTLQAANVSQQKIQGSPMEVTGFGGVTEYTMGHVQLVLRVRPIVALTRFHVVNAEAPYHVLLGRPWLHKHKLVSSTYHQCVKGRLNGKPIRIAANSSPFDQTEAHFVEAALYDDLASTGEPSIVRPCGTPLPAWEDIKDDPEVDLRELLERKKKGRNVKLSLGVHRNTKTAEEVVVDQAESMVEARNSEEVVVDQTESMAVKEEKSIIAETKMAAKEDLEVINLSNDPDVNKPISISMSLSAEERKCLIDLLHEYKDVFAWDYNEMSGIDPGLVAHSLNVEPGTRPVVQPMRTFHTEVEAQITQEVKKLLVAGFIKPIQHPRWLSNIVPVKKKNGQIRCCVDFHNLNKACPKDEFPLPNMDLLIDSVAGHAMFSFMDGFSGYNQIRMSTKNAEKLPSTHQLVFDRCRLYKLKMNPLKCAFGVSAGKFLGFLVHNHGIDVDPAKASAIATMKVPTSHKELKSFLGRLSYIRRFILGLTVVTAVFTPLMKKGVPFVWSTACQQAFEKIQVIMTKLPTVCAPVPGRPLRLYLASNSEAIGGLVAQEDEDGTKKPIYYVNRTFRDAETREDGETIAKSFKLDFSCSNIASEYEAYITELAIAHEMGIKHLRVIGDSNLIICQTKGEFSLKEPSLALYRALAQKLEENFDTFEISHAMRCGNRYASALATLGSQVSFEGPKVDVTIDKRSMPITDLLKEKFKEQNLDAEDWRIPIRAKLMSPEGVADLKILKDYVLIAGDLYRRLPGGVLARCVNLQEAAKKLTEVHEKSCEFRDGVSLYRRLQRLGMLFRKGFHGDPLRCLSLAKSQTVMKEAHSGECGEHQGKKRLYQLLLTLGYYWPTMKKDTADFVKSCHTCQLQANLIHTHPTSLQNMATPWPFHIWGLDLIGPINPPSGGYIWILVATEYFSKWVEVIPLRKATGAAVANLIREHIITRKGWSSHLADTLWAYRGSTKTVTGFTPFSLVYGTDAISPMKLLVPSPRILHGMDLEADADICAEARVANLESLEEARELAQVRSLRYHQKLANAYEKTLQTRIFPKGQMVLRIVDHVRRGLPSPSKFAPNWEGPYLIREAYDSAYYKLSTADGTILADPINGKWLKHYYS
uniref:Uncharacterized protein n=1 Tax=Fagus sylvatica TaxID=28930 RepID=A0A2N9EXF3_FAGSY